MFSGNCFSSATKEMFLKIPKIRAVISANHHKCKTKKYDVTSKPITTTKGSTGKHLFSWYFKPKSQMNKRNYFFYIFLKNNTQLNENELGNLSTTEKQNCSKKKTIINNS